MGRGSQPQWHFPLWVCHCFWSLLPGAPSPCSEHAPPPPCPPALGIVFLSLLCTHWNVLAGSVVIVPPSSVNDFIEFELSGEQQEIPNTTLESSCLELTDIWFIWCKKKNLISPLEILEPHHHSLTEFKSASGPVPVLFTLGPPLHSPARQPLYFPGASRTKSESSSSD